MPSESWGPGPKPSPQIGSPPPPPSSPDTEGEGSGHPFIVLVATLIVFAGVALTLGFFGHMLVDMFDWAWDLWGGF